MRYGRRLFGWHYIFGKTGSVSTTWSMAGTNKRSILCCFHYLKKVILRTILGWGRGEKMREALFLSLNGLDSRTNVKGDFDWVSVTVCSVLSFRNSSILCPGA